MIVVMNVLRAREGRAEDVERAFFERERSLSEMDGFAGFELLRLDREDEYVAMTRWDDHDSFRAWVDSDFFKRAHDRRHGYGAMVRGTEVRTYEVLDVEAPA
jgi:heme-degrading monooxygenase HmoA